MLKLAGLLSIALISSALAADAPPSEQALARKLNAEINAGIACDTTLITAQHMLNDDEAKIKDLQGQIDALKKAKTETADPQAPR